MHLCLHQGCAANTGVHLIQNCLNKAISQLWVMSACLANYATFEDMPAPPMQMRNRTNTHYLCHVLELTTSNIHSYQVHAGFGTLSLLTLFNAQPCSHLNDIYDSFYITTWHLHCYTVFFYKWNVTFKLLAKELHVFGSFPVHCMNFINKTRNTHGAK